MQAKLSQEGQSECTVVPKYTAGDAADCSVKYGKENVWTKFTPEWEKVQYIHFAYVNILRMQSLCILKMPVLVKC